MGNKKISVAVIANGSRATCVVRHLLKDANGGVEIAAVYDPDKEVAVKLLEKLNADSAVLTDSAEAAINADVSLLIVNIVNSGSSNTTDAICMRAYRAGIPVILPVNPCDTDSNLKFSKIVNFSFIINRWECNLKSFFYTQGIRNNRPRRCVLH